MGPRTGVSALTAELLECFESQLLAVSGIEEPLHVGAVENYSYASLYPDNLDYMNNQSSSTF